MISKPTGLLHQITRWSPPGIPSRYVSVRTASILALLGLGLIIFTLVPRTSVMVQPAPTPIFNPLPEEKAHVVDVASLIDSIRNASKHALQGRPEPEFSASDRKLWRQRNPCKSREQLQPLYALRKLTADVAPNSKWKQVFDDYEKLHRICTQNIGNDMSEYFLSKSNSSGCRFLVGGIPPRAGLGNKVLSMVSGLLYAILTQRVFLVPDETLVPGIMCEPFEGSSWLLDTKHQFTPEYGPGKDKFWSMKDVFYKVVDEAETLKTSDGVSAIHALVANDDWCQPGARFFCDTEQSYLGHIPWLYVNGCLYFLPKLFAIPSFRPVLEELFPDRMALTHLLRSAMLPSDAVWRRVEQIYSVYMKTADRLVGIQVRYRDGVEDYNKNHQMIEKRVLKCALDNKILPETNPAPKVAEAAPSTEIKQTRVYITSLFSSLHDFLSEIYNRNPPPMEYVGITQVTHGTQQQFNLEEDKQALAEVLSLSFSDYLFVTPLSTFGGLAQGYGGLTPWFIDNRVDSNESCIRAQTADTCYQIPVDNFKCPYDHNVDGKLVLDTVPYLKNCLPVDARHGIQLITQTTT